MAEFQCLIGMQCAQFAIIAADQTSTLSILLLKKDVNKIHQVSTRLMMALAGPQSNATQLSQYICKNIELYRMKNHYDLDIPAMVHFTRKTLAEQPTMLNVLMGGHDDQLGGQLFYMDMLGSSVTVPYATHGYAGMLCWSILERYYQPTLSEEEAYKILKLCISAIHERLMFSYPNFQVKVVSKDGIRELPTVNLLSCLQ